MSKPYYETEKYNEAENELDTYDDPVKLIMEYRVSEKNKDSQITALQKQLEEKEKIIEHWHNLYRKRDQQFQSVRQRYHLLNKLQSNYNKKDKLHLLGMQCLELLKKTKNSKNNSKKKRK